MLVKVLAENTAAADGFRAEHGLSLYIETKKHKLLFDTGAGGVFIENARQMGADLTEADVAVISHGHYDHGGGIRAFLRINSKADIYIHEKAFGGHYAERAEGGKAYIGLDPELAASERLIFCGDGLSIDDELELFTAPGGAMRLPSGNAGLLSFKNGVFEPDDFGHEQSLIVCLGEKYCLLAGCSHRGILNILARFRELKGRYPDCVVAGFHMYSKSAGESEAAETVDETGRLLSELSEETRYYTCHCTGTEAYRRLKAVMGGRISYISTGDIVTLF